MSACGPPRRAGAIGHQSRAVLFITRSLSGEEFKGGLGFVTWRGHELTSRESAMLGPGEWHLDVATNRLYVRLPDDSSPLARRLGR